MKKSLKIYINNLDCANCSISIDKAFKKLDLINYNIIITLKEIHIEYYESLIDQAAILKVIKKLGFEGNVIES